MGNSVALALYRELLRKTRALPRSSLGYYRNSLRSAFVNFNSEKDPQRLQEIMERGRQDADWILKKVRCQLMDSTTSPSPILYPSPKLDPSPNLYPSPDLDPRK